MKRKTLWITIAVVVVVIVAILAGLRLTKGGPGQRQAARYLTQPVDTGTITRIVSASGPLTPVNQVQVGTQVSGTIDAIYADFNAQVKVGQLLAQIDTASLDADLAQAQAALRSAQASLELANTTLARNQELFSKGFISRAEVDQAQNTVRTSKASVDQQQAAVNRATTSKRNAQITSPVSGTVVSREVSVGQTVAASLNTPVLFKIAQDLREMQVEASVAEADIGTMKEGANVQFTVDAFAGRTFNGVVHQIRNNYSVQQNVVTYTVIIRARNDQLELRPGMTAYVRITADERAQVLRIPNAALRYEPTKPAATATNATPAQPPAPGTQRNVWRIGADGTPQAVPVKLGLTDGRHTELLSGQLQSGDALIIGQPTTGGPTGPKIF
jgi:HlyD family secretion protein